MFPAVWMTFTESLILFWTQPVQRGLRAETTCTTCTSCHVQLSPVAVRTVVLEDWLAAMSLHGSVEWVQVLSASANLDFRTITGISYSPLLDQTSGQPVPTHQCLVFSGLKWTLRCIPIRLVPISAVTFHRQGIVFESDSHRIRFGL